MGIFNHHEKQKSTPCIRDLLGHLESFWRTIQHTPSSKISLVLGRERFGATPRFKKAHLRDSTVTKILDAIWGENFPTVRGVTGCKYIYYRYDNHLQRLLWIIQRNKSFFYIFLPTLTIRKPLKNGVILKT